MDAGALAIVVVNYRSSALLAANLVRVHADVPEATVVIVDNRSDDAERRSVAELAERHGWLTVLPEGNDGFGGGMNAGARVAIAAGATDLLLLNPDAVISRPSVLELRTAVDAAGRSVVASPIVRDLAGHDWFAGADLYLSDGATRSRRRRADHPGAEVVEWISGACMWVTAELWERIGGFDEDYFLYWEDVDLSRRAADAGARLLVVETAEAIHDEGGTQRDDGAAGEAKSEGYYYYNIRNRLLFAAKHLPPDREAAWRRTATRNAIAVLRRGGTRQFLKPLRPLRAAWRDLRDGRRMSARIRRQSAAVHG